MEAVWYLHNQLRGCADDGSIALAAVPGDDLYLRVRPQPVDDFLSVAWIEDGQHLPEGNVQQSQAGGTEGKDDLQRDEMELELPPKLTQNHNYYEISTDAIK